MSRYRSPWQTCDRNEQAFLRRMADKLAVNDLTEDDIEFLRLTMAFCGGRAWQTYEGSPDAA